MAFVLSQLQTHRDHHDLILYGVEVRHSGWWYVFSLVLDPEIPIIPSKKGCIIYPRSCWIMMINCLLYIRPTNTRPWELTYHHPSHVWSSLGPKVGYTAPLDSTWMSAGRFNAPGAFQRIGSGSSPWRRAHVSPMRRSNWKNMAAQTVAIPSCGTKRWEFLFLIWWIFACFFVDLWDPESTARVEWFQWHVHFVSTSGDEVEKNWTNLNFKIWGALLTTLGRHLRHPYHRN